MKRSMLAVLIVTFSIASNGCGGSQDDNSRAVEEGDNSIPRQQIITSKKIWSLMNENNNLSKPAILKCIAQCRRHYDYCVAENPGEELLCGWGYEDCCMDCYR
mgnify:CR=1 FL=1